MLFHSKRSLSNLFINANDPIKLLMDGQSRPLENVSFYTEFHISLSVKNISMLSTFFTSMSPCLNTTLQPTFKALYLFINPFILIKNYHLPRYL